MGLCQLFWLALTVEILSKLLFNKVNVCSIQKFFSRFWFSLQSQLASKGWEESIKNQESELPNQQCFDNKKDDDKNIICREDVETLMGNLELFCSEESEKLQELMGFDDLSQLFDEQEPSFSMPAA